MMASVLTSNRRLAAATGNPLSIHDDAIGTCIPGDSPGFSMPGALNVNIKLARVTGETMDGEFDGLHIDSC